jgi:hypothetical protein
MNFDNMAEIAEKPPHDQGLDLSTEELASKEGVDYAPKVDKKEVEGSFNDYSVRSCFGPSAVPMLTSFLLASLPLCR